MSDRAPTPTLFELAGPLSRRSFLGRLTAVGGAALGGSALLSACGGDNAGTEGAAGGARVVEASSCEGYGTIDAAGLQTRQSLKYVDASPKEGQHCQNCRFYNQPQNASPCGGCQLFPGPVSPGGWCQSWTQQAV